MSELKDQLNKIVERVNELENNPSELTKDALLAEVRGFYDVAKVAELNITPKASRPVAVVKKTLTPEPVIAAKPEPVKKPEPVAKKAVEPTAEKAHEPVVETPEAAATPKPAKTEEKPTAKKEPLIGKDKSAKGDDDKKILAGQFNKSPLSDLRSGIPLNEKFGIIRNLFKGNASDFGDAVLKLNNAPNGKEMTHYFELLSQRFEWDLESEAYKSFSGYVERKMMSLESSKTNAD
tara:strand:- start:181 stop:885 length:705 start_codon:yes stop_codon:yes gene_type:complete